MYNPKVLSRKEKEKHNSIINIIKRHIPLENIEEEKKIFVLGVSGGADSIFLINILYNILEKEIKKDNICLYIMHLNHNIRGNEAKRDEEFVRNLGKQMNLKTYVYSENILEDAQNAKESIETYARKRRYILMNSVLEENIIREVEKQEINVDKNVQKKKITGYIITAHNANDNAETIFMNILRGSRKKWFTRAGV